LLDNDRSGITPSGAASVSTVERDASVVPFAPNDDLVSSDSDEVAVAANEPRTASSIRADRAAEKIAQVVYMVLGWSRKPL
jgi:hypothetical protein